MIIIRADGNAKIGAGHLMRCLTIADAIVRGATEPSNRYSEQNICEQSICKQKVCFFCADEQSAELAREHGFLARVLETDYQDMTAELPVWEKLLAVDSEILQAENLENHQTTILVDSYYVTDAYLQQLKRYGRVYLMDDMQEHAYPVDGVINYNAFADPDVYRSLYKGTKTECFVGSSYVPIRQQFLNRKYEISETVKDVLITTGGGDVDNIAGELLQTIYREDMKFHVVTGKFNPHLHVLKELEKNCIGVSIYHDVQDMAGLMEKCDMAITAGGTTIYELASIGVPFLCFSYAKNQEALTEYIGNKGIAGFLGAYHKDKTGVLEQLKKVFTCYCEQYDLRKLCYEKEREMIDGKGAQRLARQVGISGGRKR